MRELRQLLTGPLTPQVFEEVMRLLPQSSLTPAEKSEIAGLLAGAGAWIEGWQEQLRLHTAEPTTYWA